MTKCNLDCDFDKKELVGVALIVVIAPNNICFFLFLHAVLIYPEKEIFFAVLWVYLVATQSSPSPAIEISGDIKIRTRKLESFIFVI